MESDGGVTSDGDVFDEEDECDTSDIEAAPTPPESPGKWKKRKGVGPHGFLVSSSNYMVISFINYQPTIA